MRVRSRVCCRLGLERSVARKPLRIKAQASFRALQGLRPNARWHFAWLTPTSNCTRPFSETLPEENLLCYRCRYATAAELVPPGCNPGASIGYGALRGARFRACLGLQIGRASCRERVSFLV